MFNFLGVGWSLWDLSKEFEEFLGCLDIYCFCLGCSVVWYLFVFCKYVYLGLRYLFFYVVEVG